jgi:flagellar biosynthesis protein FlhB
VSESPTHEASPRKLARARLRLGRPSSQALTGAVALGLGALLLPVIGERAVVVAAGLWATVLSAVRAPGGEMPALDPSAVLELAALGGGGLFAIAGVAAGAVWLQRGAIVRLAGGAGSDAGVELERGWGAERIPRAAFSIVVFFAVLGSLLWPWSDALRGMVGAWQRAPAELSPLAGSLAIALLERAAIALAVVGVLELGAQTLWYRRRLRMSRRELQEESRATEGDPHARTERRRRAHEFRMQATLLELSEVSVIVFDSERAIGLKLASGAPVVWIKATGELAATLRREANARAVPLLSHRGLAIALSTLEPNEPLPAELLQRVRVQLGNSAVEGRGHD